MRYLISVLITTAAFALSFSLTAAADLGSAYRAVAENPRAGFFQEFQKACRTSGQNLGLESDASLATATQKLIKSNPPFLAQLYLEVLEKCSDGSGATAAKQLLGNEVLLAQPKGFLLALAERKNAFELGASLVAMENDEYFAVDCGEDHKCVAGRKAMWAAKSKALSSVSTTPKIKRLQASLIKTLSAL
ncbi:hypothetical protein K2X33_16155 [bacterium]|nr:hypothetical protein [bacterium]